ncbi:MAG: hypothetical protein JNN17_03035 [Verrucomicrobiaceae bacterium]|nr:hypothetical protein [Verrucomicrobiaceae bacterium]
MVQLITWFLKWLGSKLLALVMIICILVAVAWFKSEWGRILEMKKEADATRLRMEQKQIHLSKLREKAESLGDSLRVKMDELRSLERVATSARLEEHAAWEEYMRRSSQAGWWQALFDKQKYADKATAYGNYELKRAKSSAARLAADNFRSAQNNSELSQLQGEIDTTEAEITESESRRAKLLADAEKEPLQRIVSAIQSALPAALWVLLGLIVVPIFLKAVLFYLVAPLAARMPPVNILPKNALAPVPSTPQSGTSLEVLVQPGQELLVHPDYLQSSGLPLQKRTQWFLDYRIPLTSMASHMVMLTRIRPSNEQPAKVVVSSQQDRWGEVASLELPEGASMVILPRSLAGLVKPQGKPVHITRHWRLGSLHSWLTFQFRFLVFHGPCKLILKGCRGVRAESPESESPRLINQAATLGFSTNLDYSNTRCETFISYLRGKEDLFNDLFGSGPGIFVYEEIPNAGKKSGITGRGIEGFLDGVLKAFGV